MNPIKFGELNTGDIFYYICNGQAAGARFRKSSPRDAVQQKADGSGDMTTVDAVVKTRATTKVVRGSWLDSDQSTPTYESQRESFGWVVVRIDDRVAPGTRKGFVTHVHQPFAVTFDERADADALAAALNAARK